MIQLSLRQEDAKLVYLAVAYHLGRPGSELDPITKQPLEHGLAETARELQPQLRNATSNITLDDTQLSKLMSGMLGAITELKAYPMLELRTREEGGGRRSTVPGFDNSLRHLFPDIDEDAYNSLDLAEQMLLLRRKLDERIKTMPKTEPPPASKKRGIWPFKH